MRKVSVRRVIETTEGKKPDHSHTCTACMCLCLSVVIKDSLLKREPLQPSIRHLASGCMESSNPDVHQVTRCTKTKKKKILQFQYQWAAHLYQREMSFYISVSADVIITIRGAGVEVGGFLLRDLLNFAIQLTGWGLVKPDTVSHITCLYRIQEAERPHTVDIGGVLCQIKGDLRKGQKGEEKDVQWGKLRGKISPT